jgi:hypothetical protein
MKLEGSPRRIKTPGQPDSESPVHSLERLAACHVNDWQVLTLLGAVIFTAPFLNAKKILH